MHTAMKSFPERNPLIIGAIGIALIAGHRAGALNYDKLPFVNHTQQLFGVLRRGRRAARRCAGPGVGLQVGQVRSINLDGARVLVTFTVDKTTSRLGDRTEAAIKTKSLLGAKVLESHPPR